MTVRIRLSLVLLMLLMPALALAGDKDNNDEPRDKRAGSAFAPPAHEGRPAGETQQQSKQCMKICEHWTKDCIVDRQGNRKCRRSCEQLGEHCF